MKRLIPAVIMICVTIILGIISLMYIDKADETMTTAADKILKYANEENYEKLNESVDDALSLWNRKKPVLNIFLGQKETNEITSHLMMVRQFSLEGDKASVILYTYEFKTSLDRIKRTNEPSLSTIF
ncbi:MAG: DUF4363 family protein [Clostridia bacterium]|nr:DUF4363 family protein [Clostridia bacterium]